MNGVVKRENWIDTAKAIGIILVILGHVGSGLEGWFNFRFVYGFHLIIFYMIAGYTTKTAPIDFNFVKKKFSRLMTPYFVTCFAIMVMDVINCWLIDKERSIEVITSVISKDFTRSFFASGMTTTFGNIDIGTRIGAIWFLPALFFAIVLFAFLVSRIQNNKLLGIVCAAISMVGFLTGQFIWLPFSIQSGLFTIFFVWLGYSVKKNRYLERIRLWYFIPALVLLLIGIKTDYCFMSFVTAEANDLLISTFVGLCGTLLIYLAAKVTEKSRALQWIGKRSMYVLCIHLFALETMGAYFNKILDLAGLGGQGRAWVLILIELVFALAGTVVFVLITNRLYPKIIHSIKQGKKEKQQNQKRNWALDIAKGILIISMLIGHFDINPTLRTIIFSCHMVAFVFCSGYLYKKGDDIWKSIKHIAIHFLRPYLVFCLLSLLLDIPKWSGGYFLDILKRDLLGMSFSGVFLQDIASIGPVYFILMLFVVRLIYLVIDHFVKSDLIKWIIVLLCAAIGVFLGNRGWWLPWSIDVALYSLLFYHLGVVFRKYNLVRTVTDQSWLYFLLSAIWAYMIYRGGMEIALRKYQSYGIVIIGALAGILVVLILSSFISARLFFVRSALSFIGQSCLYILIAHTLLNSLINQWLGQHMQQDGFALMCLSILLQIVIALIARIIVLFFTNIHKKKKLEGAA